MSIGFHQVDEWYSRFSCLPETVSDPSWTTTISRECFEGTVRSGGLHRWICTGPDYSRSVDDNLRFAWDAFKKGDGASFLMWLEYAVNAGHKAANRQMAAF